MDNVKQIMKKPVSIENTASIFKAMFNLIKLKKSRLLTTNDSGDIVGIITEKDITKAIYVLGDKPIRSIKISSFMSKNLITIKKTDSIYDCAKLMKKHHISSIIVVGKNDVLEGLVTKTDLVSIFLTHAILPLKISKIMTRNVVTVMPGDSLLYVESLLMHNRIARLVVQRDRVPVGIITYRDFVPAKLPYWIAQTADPQEVENYKMKSNINEFQSNQLNHLLHFKAVDIMSSNPITVEADEDVGVAVLLMIRNEISGLPVVKKSKLIGIITKSDIVKAIAEG